MNLDFVKLTNKLASSKGVPDNLIDCMEKLDIPWKSTHVHKKINIELNNDHNTNYAKSLINQEVDIFSKKTLTLMTYIPDNDDDIKFKKKREDMYDLCLLFWKEEMTDKKNGNQFPKDLWEKSDNIVFETIIKSIEKKEKIGKTFTINLINKFLKYASEYYPNYISYKIIPNKNGKFCKKLKLFKDDDIPDIFKECLMTCFDKDINEHLVDDRINSIKISNKKTISDYKDLLEQYFNAVEKKRDRRCYDDIYLSLEKKIEAAEYLIRIIPKNIENKNDLNCENTENSESDYDNNVKLNKQRTLFEIYKFFTGNNCEFYEVERNKCDYYSIWHFSNKYIYKIIKDIIENCDDLNSLSKSIKKNEEEIINNLNKFIKFSSGKIFLNQNNKLCKKDNLCNEKDWEKGEELKKIALFLEYDVKEKLVHEKMVNSILKDMKSQEICTEIDKRLSEKYKDISNYQKEDFKNSCKYLLNYFDSIGEKKASNYFPRIFLIKESIAYNVIYDEKTRKNFANLDKSFNLNNLSELVENAEIKNVIKNFIDDENYRNDIINIEKIFKKEGGEKTQKIASDFFSLYGKIGKEGISKLSENSKIGKFILNIITNEKIYNNFDRYDITKFINFFDDIENEKKVKKYHKPSNYDSNRYETSYNSIQPISKDESNREESFLSEIPKNSQIFIEDDDLYYEDNKADDKKKDINKKIEIIGQIYIYELLLNSEKFRKVKWTLLEESGNANYEEFEYNGKTYKLINNISNLPNYDIQVETFDDRNIYIEVKSSKNEFETKSPIYISHKQVEMMEKIDFPNEYFIAMVFNTLENPNHFFMTLRKKIINN